MKARSLLSHGFRGPALPRPSCSLLLLAALGTAAFAEISNYQSIDSTKMPPAGWENVSWTDIGGWTTINVSTQGLPPDNPTIDASAQVASIISSTSGNRILYFPSGTYHFKTPLTISTGNLRLKGNGKTNTTFIIDIPVATNAATLQFRGSASGSPIEVISAVTAGVKTVTVANATDLTNIVPGNFVRLYAANWIVETASNKVGQVFRVESKSGATLTLDMEMGVAIPVDATVDRDPVIEKLNLVSNVGLEDLTIHRIRADNDSFSANFALNWVYNGRIINVESSFGANSHLGASYSKKLVIENCDVHDAYDYGDGGNGYGIVFENTTTQARASNNKVWNLRHHLLLAAGANHCVLSYNSVEDNSYLSPNSIVTHGRYAHNNLFEGNQSSGHMAVDNAHGDDGPRNTFFRNFGSDNIVNFDVPAATNFIGNLADFFQFQANDYAGANRQGGTIRWDAFNSGSTFPPSLYTDTKPAFLGTKPWPIYGPTVDATWGTGNTLPAMDRPKPPAYVALFSDNFEDGNATGWTVVTGTAWSVVSDGTFRYQQASTTTSALALAGSTSWDDYVVLAKIKTTAVGTNGTGPGLVFRAQDPSNYYFFQLRPDGFVRLYKTVGGTPQQIGASIPFASSLGTTYELSVAVYNSTIRCSVNGTLLISANDTAIGAGRIGLRTSNTAVRLDDVLVIQ